MNIHVVCLIKLIVLQKCSHFQGHFFSPPLTSPPPCLSLSVSLSHFQTPHLFQCSGMGTANILRRWHRLESCCFFFFKEIKYGTSERDDYTKAPRQPTMAQKQSRVVMKTALSSSLPHRRISGGQRAAISTPNNEPDITKC